MGQVLICDRCGAEIPDEATEALAWTTSLERGRRVHYCVSCSRDNLRAIEAKLDSEWW